LVSALNTFTTCQDSKANGAVMKPSDYRGNTGIIFTISLLVVSLAA